MLDPPVLIVSFMMSCKYNGEIVTFQNVDTLGTEIVLVGSAVVDIP